MFQLLDNSTKFFGDILQFPESFRQLIIVEKLLSVTIHAADEVMTKSFSSRVLALAFAFEPCVREFPYSL